MTPRFITDTDLREHFGLSDRALVRLRATCSFPQGGVVRGRTKWKGLTAADIVDNVPTLPLTTKNKTVTRKMTGHTNSKTTMGYVRNDDLANNRRVAEARPTCGL